MRYFATARAYATGVRAVDGTAFAVTTALAVTSEPGDEPTMRYGLEFEFADGTMTGLVSLPAHLAIGALPAYFDRLMAENAAVLSALGPFGLSLAAPSVTSEPDGTRTLRAPFLELRGGLAAREGRLGGDAVTRLAETGVSISRSCVCARGSG